MTVTFHEVLFPLDIALKSAGGPERKTEIVRSAPAARNAMRAGRIRAAAMTPVTAARHSRRCRRSSRSSKSGVVASMAFAGAIGSTICPPRPASRRWIRIIATGDGTTTTYQLVKTYGSAYAPYQRPIAKPVSGSVRVAVAGSEVALGTAFSCDATTGLITFLDGHVPAASAAITAGFQFDVPVCFDTDYLEVDLSAFTAGAIPKIPLVEIKP